MSNTIVENSNEVKKDKIVLTKKDINKSFVRWIFFSHSCYNYERLQGLGVAHAMSPIIKKLYKTKEDRAAALKRSMTFFNCEPTFRSLIHGFIIALEEKKANGEEIPDETINALKTSLMGPLSGIGDSVLQGLLAVVLLSIGIDMAREGNVFGPILFLLGTIIPVWGFGYVFFHKGYKLGRTVIQDILANGRIKTLTNAASVIGLSVMGAMTALNVKIATKVEFVTSTSTTKLQDMFDKILPNMLPLALVVLCWYLLSKNWKPTKIILLIFAIGFAGTLIGLF